MINVIYLASHTALLDYPCVYQDINGKRDIGGDMLDVDLSNYDFIIASPPCNYWSHANNERRCSDYSKKTKHLLPFIIKKLINLNKPFIVENVRNNVRFSKAGLFDLPVFVYFIGRHTYFTNLFLTPIDIEYLNSIQERKSVVNLSSTIRQGGHDVNCVFNYILSNEIYKMKLL